MSTTMTAAEVRDQWDDLIRRLAPGDEIVITDNARPVARLVGEAAPAPPPPRAAPGFLKDMILYMAPDFDDPIEDMKEYME